MVRSKKAREIIAIVYDKLKPKIGYELASEFVNILETTVETAEEEVECMVRAEYNKN